MVKNMFDRIVSKLGEARKEHFPTSREIEEKKRLEEERERRAQYKIYAKREREIDREIANEEREIRESNERFNKIIRGLQSLDPPQLSKEKSLNQQSAKERLSSLRKYYNRLILQNKELSEAGYKRKYELIDRLKDYRRRARATGNPYFLEHGRFARYIKEAETLIREMPIEIRQVKEKMGKQIKMALPSFLWVN